MEKSNGMEAMSWSSSGNLKHWSSRSIYFDTLGDKSYVRLVARPQGLVTISGTTRAVFGWLSYRCHLVSVVSDVFLFDST